MDISKPGEQYRPDSFDQKVITFVSKEIDDMVTQRNMTWLQFNNRTLTQFLDDSEKRLNAHIVSRESQGKENWQSNVSLPTVRDKTTKMLAGFSLQVPDMNAQAFGEDYRISVNRAEIAKWLVIGSYTQEENPVLQNFWESFHCATQGTVVKYEGYLKTRYMKKVIESYDITTGQVTFTEREVDVDDKCISLIVPLSEFFIKSFTTLDVQDQDSCAWIRYVSKENFEYEFSKYAKAKFVKTRGELIGSAEVQTQYYDPKWKNRVKNDNQVEIVRYYNKLRDQYVIIANGVLLLNAPLLWEINGAKVYPFAKTIWAPFTNAFFFYGNAVGNIFMGQYDTLNTLWNSVMDKEFRSLVPFLLVGRVNQDAFDLEDDILTLTTKVTVEDVAQVKELKLDGPSQADSAMIEMVARGIDEAAPSLPSLLSGKNPTAREIVIAEEKLREIKTVHQEMLADLWRQKYALRLANIQMNYPQPRKIALRSTDETTGKGTVTEKEVYRTYVINNAVLDQETGERGVLAIQFKPFMMKDKRKIADEIAVEEEVLKQQGINYKKLVLPVDFLDNYVYQMEVVPDSLHKTSLAKMQSIVLEKLANMQKLFPQVFVVNQDDLFREFSGAYDDDPGKYLSKVSKFREQVDQIKQAQGGAGQPQTEPATVTEGAPQR